MSPDTVNDRPPTSEAVRQAFDEAHPYTVGIEDEVMLLDPESYELVPRGQEVLALLPHPGPYKLELPASQLEIVTEPAETAAQACRALWEARAELVRRTEGLVRWASAGVHPFSPGQGELNELARYQDTIAEFGSVARRQLVCALQVHVAPGNADRALAVYNAARSFLPLVAALAANAPFYEGRDTGLASIRPKLCELLPRQGVPPAIESWERFAQHLHWGASTGRFRPGAWWWELRPHRSLGTLEFRVPDGQSSPVAAAAVVALVQALVVWLSRRHDQGEELEVAPSWAIAENRWSACRDGVEGQMADLNSGELVPTRVRLVQLLDQLEPVAAELGSAALLGQARELIQTNGAMRQRDVAAADGMTGLVRWLSQSLLDPLAG